MKRFAGRIIAGIILSGGCSLAAAQVAAGSSSGAAAGGPSSQSQMLLQFDQLRVAVPAGQPLPPPDAFEQQYVSVQQILKGDSLDQINRATAELRAKLPKPASMDHAVARANVEGAGEMAEGLVLSRVPVVGMVVETVQGGITSEVRKKHVEHQIQAIQQYSQTMLSLYQRPQLLHVSAWGDRLRVEDADTGEITLVQPDRQRRVVLTPFDKSYVIQPLAGDVSFSQFSCDSAPADVKALGSTQIADVPVQGYEYREPGQSPDGNGREITVTRYVSTYTLPLESMNALRGTDCAADSASVRNTPGGADHLVVYAGYAHDAPELDNHAQETPEAMMEMMSGQTVLWRGHLHTAPADPALFEIPPDYKPVAPVSLPAPPATTTTARSD
ncbi:MAG TPA: hypothetical protein VN725_03720 [Rhodanobacteraceae bacterium]|nr:hypothetical protein [Rhodanobacteraceae bacterium]